MKLKHLTEVGREALRHEISVRMSVWRDTIDEGSTENHDEVTRFYAAFRGFHDRVMHEPSHDFAAAFLLWIREHHGQPLELDVKLQDIVTTDLLSATQLTILMKYRKAVNLLCVSPPASLMTWSLDEVAECLPGISSRVYEELWLALDRADAAGTAKPPGGDGSDGTIEEPVVTSGSYDSDLAAAWNSLSWHAKTVIHEAAARAEDERGGGS